MFDPFRKLRHAVVHKLPLRRAGPKVHRSHTPTTQAIRTAIEKRANVAIAPENNAQSSFQQKSLNSSRQSSVDNFHLGSKAPEEHRHPLWGRSVELSDAQEELQDSREELLGARFSLRSQRTKLTQLRQETGGAEGGLLMFVRQNIQGADLTSSDKLDSLVGEYSLLRDRLGIAEVNYEQAEQKYNTLEWNYTQKEERFLRLLREQDQAIGDLASHSRGEIEELTRFSHGSLEPTKTHHEFQDQQTGSTSVFRTGIRESDLDRLDPAAILSTQVDSIENVHESSWLKALAKINSWLLQGILCSTLQEARIRELLLYKKLNDPDWRNLVVQHWDQDDLNNLRPYQLELEESEETIRDQQKDTTFSNTPQIVFNSNLSSANQVHTNPDYAFTSRKEQPNTDAHSRIPFIYNGHISFSSEQSSQTGYKNSYQCVNQAMPEPESPEENEPRTTYTENICRTDTPLTSLNPRSDYPQVHGVYSC
ncbi:hypothetical protein BU24DRAFT_421927 [Aaosphaeria arxii CBS 175.79]|uniref:Uncharacterized protein n=1 Tax=Aaosphaeria arxii CBS 175.79 TaxID=1450172 RepID=A0A6A5XQS6_9PLEO|nr:uncharacterized protein BU24DRAFT_421927 [Aaosphaeria arxii CBS 175.79]KAF2015628.1 hypothetical protein BU24DRAFT_421927 [Aaosphaeria arxii CBS 175.79]